MDWLWDGAPPLYPASPIHSAIYRNLRGWPSNWQMGQAPITINGTEYSKTDTDAGVTIASKKVTLADDKFYDQGWNHISINASGATAETLFTTFQSSGSGNVARYYIDNLVVTSVQ